MSLLLLHGILSRHCCCCGGVEYDQLHWYLIGSFQNGEELTPWQKYTQPGCQTVQTPQYDCAQATRQEGPQ